MTNLLPRCDVKRPICALSIVFLEHYLYKWCLLVSERIILPCNWYHFLTILEQRKGLTKEYQHIQKLGILWLNVVRCPV